MEPQSLPRGHVRERLQVVHRTGVDGARVAHHAEGAQTLAMGARPVTRQELHARMDHFHRLLVLRPDGYMVRPLTGEAMQKAGQVRLAEDGTLRAGRFEVGLFYAIESGRLWLVDAGLEVPRGGIATRPLRAR